MSIKFLHFIRILHVHHRPVFRMLVVDLVNIGGVFEKSLKFLITVILRILLKIKGFGKFEFIDKGKLSSDLSSIAEEFG
jgi:hypothetical protein